MAALVNKKNGLRLLNYKSQALNSISKAASMFDVCFIVEYCLVLLFSFIIILSFHSFLSKVSINSSMADLILTTSTLHTLTIDSIDRGEGAFLSQDSLNEIEIKANSPSFSFSHSCTQTDSGKLLKSNAQSAKMKARRFIP